MGTTDSELWDLYLKGLNYRQIATATEEPYHAIVDRIYTMTGKKKPRQYKLKKKRRKRKRPG